MSDDKPKCGAKLFIGDDFGDNSATMTCDLPPGHGGLHQETFWRHNPNDLDADLKPALVTWPFDERLHCKKHGIQPSGFCPACIDEEFEDDESEPISF